MAGAAHEANSQAGKMRTAGGADLQHLRELGYYYVCLFRESWQLGRSSSRFGLEDQDD